MGETLVEIVPSASGLPSLRALDGGRQVWLHSSYEPRREAMRWARGQAAEPGDTIVVLGVGLGYHLEGLAGLYPESTILAVEPVEAVAVASRESQVVGRLLESGRVCLHTGDNLFRLRDFLLGHLQPEQLDKVKILEYPPLVRAFPEEYGRAHREVVEVASFLFMSLTTTLFFSGKWTENFLRNMRHALNSPGVSRLFNAFAGKPGVIVSAGPSLDKNIHLLKEAKGRAVILAVGTSLRPILQQGMEPDLVVSIDGGEPNYRHFEGLQVKHAPLVFDPVVHWWIPAEYTGPKLAARCLPLMDWLEETIQEPKGSLRVGPSVANVAFDLALQMGLNPIIFIGQDLAYPGRRSHARGTAWESRDVTRRKLIEVEDVFGGKVETDQSLYSMLQWLEQQISWAGDTVRVIDATEGGARIKGTEVMSFREAIDRFMPGTVDVGGFLRELFAAWRGPGEEQLAAFEEGIATTTDQLKTIERLARVGKRYSEALGRLYENGVPSNGSKVNSLLEKLDRVDARLLEYSHTSRLLFFTLQPVFLRVLKAFQAAPDEDLPAAGRRISKKSKFLYEGIEEAAKAVRKIIREVYESDIWPGRAADGGKLDAGLCKR